MKIIKHYQKITIAMLIVLVGTSTMIMHAMEKEFERLKITPEQEELSKEEWTIENIKDNYLIISGDTVPLWARIKNTDSEDAFTESEERRRSEIPKYARSRDISKLYKQSNLENRILFTQEEPLLIPLYQINYPLIIRIWDFSGKNKDYRFSADVFRGNKEEIESFIGKPGLYGYKIEGTGWDLTTGKAVKLAYSVKNIANDINISEFNPKILTLPWKKLSFEKVSHRTGGYKQEEVNVNSATAKMLRALKRLDYNEIAELLKQYPQLATLKVYSESGKQFFFPISYIFIRSYSGEEPFEEQQAKAKIIRLFSKHGFDFADLGKDFFSDYAQSFPPLQKIPFPVIQALIAGMDDNQIKQERKKIFSEMATIQESLKTAKGGVGEQYEDSLRQLTTVYRMLGGIFPKEAEEARKTLEQQRLEAMPELKETQIEKLLEFKRR